MTAKSLALTAVCAVTDLARENSDLNEHTAHLTSELKRVSDLYRSETKRADRNEREVNSLHGERRKLLDRIDRLTPSLGSYFSIRASEVPSYTNPFDDVRLDLRFDRPLVALLPDIDLDSQEAGKALAQEMARKVAAEVEERVSKGLEEIRQRRKRERYADAYGASRADIRRMRDRNPDF